MDLLPEDLLAIDKMCNNILLQAAEMDSKTLQQFLKDFNKHIGMNPSAVKDLKGSERYTFFSNNSVNVAIYLFYSNRYNVKRIARNSYVMDEDSKFIESMDMEIPLGYFVLPNGGIIKTGVVEVTMKVRPFKDVNPITKMPFDILSFKLIKPY